MSWFDKPLNKGIAIGAGVLALVVIALIIYGVVTHREPVLLEVCWENGQARYVSGTEVDSGACEGAQELVWPTSQIPLTVAASAPDDTLLAPGTKQREGLDAAIRDINSQVGCKLLAPASDGVGAAVVGRLGEAVEVPVGEARGSKALGWARHYRADSAPGGLLRCDLHVSSACGGLRCEYLVAHHELLHCLGLAHDPDNPASAIYPLTADDTMWDRMQAARITDADRSRLRDLYCR